MEENKKSPSLSYTIWFSQRTGSTLLCKALESTGIVGKPNEWLHEHETYDLYKKYQVDNPVSLQRKLWEMGSTGNGIFGLKTGASEPHNGKMIETFRQFPGCKKDANRPEVWENAFPNHRHIWMTRRNKVRLAVSWWKAIKTNEWHRKHGSKPSENDVRSEYLYDALNHLFNEAALREVLAQKFFDEGEIVPYTVVYEDFVKSYEKTIESIVSWLGVNEEPKISKPFYEKLSDEVSEEWVERFERERTERLGKD